MENLKDNITEFGEEYLEVPDDDRDLISRDPYGWIATDPFEHLIQMGRDAHRYK